MQRPQDTTGVIRSHCIVSPSLIYGFWLPLWYLVAIALSLLLWFTASDYPCGILWPLHCLSFFDLRLLITPVVSCGHCIVSPSLTCGFWLPLWCLQTFLMFSTKQTCRRDPWVVHTIYKLCWNLPLFNSYS